MPRPADVPASLKDLAFENTVPVRPDPDFHRDLDRLIRAIKVGGAAAQSDSTTACSGEPAAVGANRVRGSRRNGHRGSLGAAHLHRNAATHRGTWSQ